MKGIMAANTRQACFERCWTTCEPVTQRRVGTGFSQDLPKSHRGDAAEAVPHHEPPVGSRRASILSKRAAKSQRRSRDLPAEGRNRQCRPAFPMTWHAFCIQDSVFAAAAPDRAAAPGGSDA